MPFLGDEAQTSSELQVATGPSLSSCILASSSNPPFFPSAHRVAWAIAVNAPAIVAYPQFTVKGIGTLTSALLLSPLLVLLSVKA